MTLKLLQQSESSAWRRWRYFSYLLTCFIASMIFPISSLLMEMSLGDLPFSWASIVHIHSIYYSQFILDSIPIALTIIYYFIVKHAIISKKNIATHFAKQYSEAKSDLNNSMTRLSYIVENSPASYLIVEPTGIISYANSGAKSFFDLNHCVGLNIFNFKSILGTEFEDRLVSGIEGNIETLQHYCHKKSDAEEKNFLNIKILPNLTGKKNDVNEILVIISDMTFEVQLRNKAETSYLNIVKSLAKALDARDKYTANHSSNVRRYVELLAKTIMVDENDIRKMIIAAELHDIGKIGVPDSILNKPDKLSEEELTIMKLHPVIGAELLKDMEGYRQISNVILHHHEFWNGRGYPNGLQGNDIPVGAQIIAIADFFDAVTTERVYRKAMPYELAFDLLEDAKGTLLNPDLVDFFISEFKHSLETRDKILEIEFTTRH